MKIITDSDIQKLNIKEIDCLDWINFIIKNKNSFIMPPKQIITHTHNYYFMPSILESENISGIKIVNDYKDRNPKISSDICLYNYKNGNLKAVINANFITNLRTALTTLFTINLILQDNFKVISLIGLGIQAKEFVKVLMQKYNNPITLKILKYKNQHIEFIEYTKSLDNKHLINFEICQSINDVATNADIIINSATTQDNLQVDYKHLKKGALVFPINRNAFIDIQTNFDLIITDDKNQLNVFDNLDKNKVYELTDILNKGLNFNSTTPKIIYNLGLSITDIYFAEQIFKKLF